MDLRNIAQVAHTDRQEDVNKMLEDGWVLLATSGGKDEEGYPIFWHALGRPEDPILFAIELLQSRVKAKG
ncbi:hypothetical protein [Stenotrophomonas maltophilia]|uniref:hypothetical protein n=1 Tax=Stenotrophomonas maltophilia TaxID=40324 RepID=UPI0015E04AB2|nr:hypothetical protein [Stenotrophomonas maltophilia]MBA0449347.1 hypothetical protein [Stenotrophomonas maltophilia]